MNIVVFDLETKAHPGVDCKWEEKDKMGISVGVAYAYGGAGEYHIYLDDNMEKLAALLEQADLVTGFNILTFDIPLLEATIGRKLNLKATYDVFPEARDGALPHLKDDHEHKDWKYSKGYNVNNIIEGIYGDKWLKTADGAEAPKMYKDGRMGELISYCTADVHRERLLFETCWYSGKLRSSLHMDAGFFNVKRPQEVMGVPLDVRLPWSMFRTSDRGLGKIMGEFKEVANVG